MRRETLYRLIMTSAVALPLVAQESDSHVLLVWAWFYFPVALLLRIRFADTSPRLFGPVSVAAGHRGRDRAGVGGDRAGWADSRLRNNSAEFVPPRSADSSTRDTVASRDSNVSSGRGFAEIPRSAQGSRICPLTLSP
jgi:hypothetical protein